MIAVNATALIAEDEPLLATALCAELKAVWPQLRVVATVGDGASAIREALTLQPDVLFFDIQMPGMNGLDAAIALADAWPSPPCGNSGGLGKPFPALVFVTAYDQYALQAFEAQAVDYVLKPVQPLRLQKTIAKIQLSLANRSSGSHAFEATLAQLRSLVGATQSGQLVASATVTPLKLIQASVGTSIRMVPVDEVTYFEAADKYVRVFTAKHEYLIRTPLKELTPQLDAQAFWQIHRGTVVRVGSIESVTRDEAGKLWLTLRGLAPKIAVSRLYAHLFKAM